MTSPPAVIGDLVIAGSSMGDNYKSVFPRGVVRAYSAVTGEKKWSWDPVTFDTAHKSGAANAWSVISVDEERNLVFVPTGCSSPDYYGGNRLGDNFMQIRLLRWMLQQEKWYGISRWCIMIYGIMILPPSQC
jgi:quinoprotein glucose dehydrogenase